MGGLTSLLLLLCVGVTLSAVLDLQKRIWRGRRCENDTRQYHVRLTSNDGTDDWLCGGSLISDHWILTAGHCWEEGWTISAEVGVHPGPAQPAVPITERPVKFIGDQNRIHDIMLLRLTNPAPINHIIPLPNCAPGLRPTVRDIVQVAGHGPTAEDAEFSDTLQCVDLTRVDCPLMVPYEHVFCGNNRTPGVRTCGGDSGGGVEYNGQIYGVHKGSFNDTCPRISGFMDVCEYMGWIQRITGIH